MRLMPKTETITSFLQDRKKMKNLLELLSNHRFDLELDFKDEKISLENLDIVLNGKLNIKVKGEKIDKGKA